MKKLAPVCLFVFNRLNETKRTIQELQKNFLALESDLIIFSDGVRGDQSDAKVIEVRNYIRTVSGFKSIQIVEAITNNGLANSIIEGVTQTLNKYGKVIVLEDDLITTPNFLTFMNEALDFYKESSRVQSVNGYSLKIQNKEDVYFHRRAFPWGWGTWDDRWSKELFDKDKILKMIKTDKKLLKDFNKICGSDISSMLKDSISGVNNSWYVRWVFNHFINKKLSVYPATSKVRNIGFINEGTHCVGINTYKEEIDIKHNVDFSFFHFKESNKIVNDQFLKYFKKNYKIWFRIKLLVTPLGRTLLFNEIRNKYF
jgi:hypothetical protein